MEEQYTVTSKNLPKHIKKGHQLVFSRQDLSAREADIFALLIANMKPEDWNTATPKYEFTAHQLSEWLAIDSKHIGSNLSPVADRLAGRKIGIKLEGKNGDVEFDYTPLFKNIRYKNGVLSMIPNDMLKSEYIEYNQGFALINTRNFFDVKKEYAKRLYELLSRFKDQGYEMKAQSIDDLKGVFGLLDEKGKLKKDKKSFANNSTFMKRCIRNSIEELSNNSKIKKELLFLENSKGDLGYELIKKGRSITGIKFLFRWINKGTVEELNVHDAMKAIRELELKRLQNSEKLLDAELEALALAYRYIGKEDRAIKIEHTLEQRKQADVIDIENDDIDSLLEKIDSLSDLSDNPDY